MQKRFTLIIPTHNHGELLRYSVGSVLKQTVADWELFIIGDGATPETRTVAQELASSDERITFFDHPKHPRRGEPYRHELLSKRAQGEYVCYLCDDDLWMPNHLTYMHELLQKADLAHPLSCYVDGRGEVGVRPIDLAQAYYRELALGGESRVGLSSLAHRLSYYKTLPYGWRVTPQGTPTDLYMFQQFLAQPDLRVVSGTQPTLLSFPDGLRKDFLPEQKKQELIAWSSRMQRPGFMEEWRALLLQAAYRNVVALEAELAPKANALPGVMQVRDQLATAAKAYREHAERLEKGYREAIAHYTKQVTLLQQALDAERSRSGVVPASKLGR